MRYYCYYCVVVFVICFVIMGYEQRVHSADNVDCTAKQWYGYRNEPVADLRGNDLVRFQTAVNLDIVKPSGLMHRGKAIGIDSIIGLTTYVSFARGFRRFVGSLRRFGFDGQIILGVNPNTSVSDMKLLQSYDVTTYAVEPVECSVSISTREQTKGLIRGKCAKGLETLKLEWARFELARQWLSDCPTCSGWTIVMDVRDAFFQANPFDWLYKRGQFNCASNHFYNENYDLYFVEEIGPHTSPIPDQDRYFVAGNPRSNVHTVPCYGKQTTAVYKSKPVLCSGTIIGSKTGIFRFLNVLVDEFHHNNKNGNLNCRSPHTTDQWIMNWLYYNGRFGDFAKTATLPFGAGPVLTVGKACMTKDRKTGAGDIVQLSPDGSSIMNSIENISAPIVHQFDRCGKWIEQFLSSKSSVYFS